MKETLNIGVNIFISSNGFYHIKKIVRETPTMWVTENNTLKIYKNNNEIVGKASDIWNNTTFEIAKQQHYDLIEKNKLISKLTKFNFNELSFEQLKDIDNIIIENKK